jgi:hypothetical protein
MSNVPTIIDRADGVVTGVNLKRLNEIPFMLLPNAPNNQLVIPSAQTLQQIVMSISGEGPAQITMLAAERELSTSTGQGYGGHNGSYPSVAGGASPSATSIYVATVLLQIQDGQGTRALMNGAAHIDTIFGNFLPGNKAYPLAEALYVDEQRKILISATDLSQAPPAGSPPVAVTNNIRPNFIAERLLTRVYDPTTKKARDRMDKRQYLSMPYFYVLDNGFSKLAANGTNTETISLGQDSHFELFQLTAVATGGLGSFLINIVDQATGESVFDAPQGVSFPVSSGLVVGNASFPVRLHEPRFFEVGGKLVVTLTDVSGNPNTVYLTLGGRALADRMWQ